MHLKLPSVKYRASYLGPNVLSNMQRINSHSQWMATSMGINSSMQCNKTAICNPDKNEIGLLMRPKGYVSSLNKPGLIHLRKK